MSTSVEQLLQDGSVALLRPLPYDHPVAHDLVEQVQEEYVQRYGGRGAAVVGAAGVLPPRGGFLAAEIGGGPAGRGGGGGGGGGGGRGKGGGGGGPVPPR